MGGRRSRKEREAVASVAVPPGAPALGLEAQLAYATALVAGCAYLLVSLVGYTREPGWDGLLSFALAIGGTVVLQVVILGMALFIFFRGHWMAVVLREERAAGVPAEPADVRAGAARPAARPARGWLARVGSWFDSDLFAERSSAPPDRESLDAICVTLFFRTFRFFHRGLNVLIMGVSFRLALLANPLIAWPSLALLLFMLSVPVLAALSRVLFFLPVLSRAADSWRELQVRARRSLGLWSLSGDRGAGEMVGGRSLGLAVGALCAALFAGGVVSGLWCDLTTDKALYSKGADHLVVLRLRMGGVRPDRFVETRFASTVSGLERGAPEPRWERAGGNVFVAVLRTAQLKPGPCEVALNFTGYTANDPGERGAVSIQAGCEFLVVE